MEDTRSYLEANKTHLRARDKEETDSLADASRGPLERQTRRFETYRLKKLKLQAKPHLWKQISQELSDPNKTILWVTLSWVIYMLASLKSSI